MKLNGAIVCSNCEEIYSSQYEECPSCLGRHYWHLRDYVEPLFKFGGPHETVINKVQEEPPRISDDPDFRRACRLVDSQSKQYVNTDASTTYPVSISDCGRNPTGTRSVPRSLDYTSRVLGEAISRLLKICGGLNASDAVRVDEVDKEAVARP